MLTLKIFRSKVVVTFGFLFLVAINAASKDDITLICLLFCIAHELSHLFAMRLFGISLDEVRFYGGGIKIEGRGISFLPTAKKAVIYSAGCVFNLSAALVLMLLGAYEMSAVNLCIAVFNLMPIDYFDGGKLLALSFNGDRKLLKTVSDLFKIIVVLLLLPVFFAKPFEISFSAVMTPIFIALSDITSDRRS